MNHEPSTMNVLAKVVNLLWTMNHQPST